MRCIRYRWCKDAPIVDYKDENGEYCVFHAPEGKKGVSEDEFDNLVTKKIRAAQIDKSECDLSGTIFDTGLILKWFDNDDPLPPMNFSRAVFVGKADFSGATFSGRADFVRAKFKKQANFDEAIFKEEADFWDANFDDGVHFHEANFNKRANFMEATFHIEAVFRDTTFNKTADFSKAEFFGSAFFYFTDFDDSAFFHGAEFPEGATFIGTTFSGNTSFTEIIFGDAGIERMADFTSVTFENETNFDSTIFECKASFLETSFDGESSFELTKFEQHVSFERAVFKNRTQFIGGTTYIATKDGEEREVSGHVFEKEVTFKEAFFDGKLFFTNCNLNKARFIDTDLRKTDFRNPTWAKNSAGEDVLYDEKELDEKNTPADNTAIEKVEILYRRLKQKYTDEHDWPEVSNWHLREKEMARRRAHLESRWLHAAYWLYGESCGYGERPRVAAIVFGLLIIIFSGFSVASGLKPATGTPEWVGTLSWFSKPPAYLLNTLQSVTFLKTPYFAPSNLISAGIKFLSQVLVPVQAAFLVLALRNRFRR